MANSKSEGTQRVKKLIMIDPKNLAYVQEMGKKYARGGRGGESEAINRMIKFVREFNEAED